MAKRYRMLKKGEKVKKGDEFWQEHYKHWWKSGNYPGNQSEGHKYRRPIKGVGK
jgi:hypothetical protein